MNTILKQTFKLLFFASFGLGVLWLVYNNQNTAYIAQCQIDGISPEKCSLVRKLINDFRHINYGWMAGVWVVFTLSNLSRAIRWQMLIEPLGKKPRLSTTFWAVILGYFANLGLPRAGEVLRAGTVAKYEAIPTQKIIGTVVVERMIDMIAFAMIVGVAFLLEFNTLWQYIHQKGGMTSADKGHAWIFGATIFGVMACLGIWFFRKKIGKIGFLQPIFNLADGFLQGILSVKKVKYPGRLLFHSISIYMMYYLQTWFSMKCFAPTADMSLSQALMVFVMGSMGFIIPSPGGMGTYHALTIAALSLYGIRGDDGFSFANISFFSIQIVYCALFGIVALVLLPILNRKKKEKIAPPAIMEEELVGVLNESSL
jgi:glycosyltransferase 2 family protein